MWRRALREAEALGGEEMKAVLSELAPYQDADTLWSATDTASVPVLPLKWKKQYLERRASTVGLASSFPK